MTIATTAAMPIRTSRWLLFASLALNLFFVGVAGAMIVRGYFSPSPPGAPVDRSVSARIERLAAAITTSAFIIAAVMGSGGSMPLLARGVIITITGSAPMA